MSFTIREMAPGDWPRVAAVYAEGIATGNSTFETEVPPYEQWASKHLPGFSLVACDGADCDVAATVGNAVIGWAALSPYSSRRVYAGVAEASVYVGREHRGQGAGKALLIALIGLTESRGIWTLQAGIFPENVASVSMCKKLGFREVGVRRRIGRLNGTWRDVLLLERRSDCAGVD